MRIFAIKLMAVIFFAALTISGITACSNENKVTLNVSAGAGLTDALTEINSLIMSQNSDLEIMSNFAAAGDLQTQIENGAPTDIFISAAADQMNALEEQGLILPETRRDIVGNTLVLVVHRDSPLEISGFRDLLNNEINLIAMGDPDFVPAGSYGLQTLELLNVSYAALQPKLVLGNSVRQVLSYVESKNVDAGIVYASDAFISDSVKIVASAPAEITDSIVFPAAIVASSSNREAAEDYLNFLSSKEAGEIFIKHGFITLSN